jgi:mitofusin
VPYATEVSSFGAASLALGAYSMINGKTVGVRSLIESAIRLCDFASSPIARKWAGPVVGALALGSVAYVVYELPRSVPRNVGRHLQETLNISSGMGGDADLVPFSDAVSGRVSKEVRNVMRAITRDLQDLYGKAVETRAQVVKQSEEAEKKANAALGHFATIEQKVQDIRETIADIKI